MIILHRQIGSYLWSLVYWYELVEYFQNVYHKTIIKMVDEKIVISSDVFRNDKCYMLL